MLFSMATNEPEENKEYIDSKWVNRCLLWVTGTEAYIN